MTTFARLIPTVNLKDLKPIDINKNQFIVGRLPSCDHVFSDIRSSSKHAIIRFNPSTKLFTIQDNASNGTYLNTKRIGKGNTLKLKHNDIIAFVRNRIEFKFIITSISKSKPPIAVPSNVSMLSLEPFIENNPISPPKPKRKRKQEWNDDFHHHSNITVKSERNTTPPKKKRKLLHINDDIVPLHPLEPVSFFDNKESDKNENEIKKENKLNNIKNPRRMRASDVRLMEIETKSGLFSGFIALMIAKKSRRLDIIMQKFIENGGEIYDEMDVCDNYELIKQMNTIIVNKSMPYIKIQKVIKDDMIITKYDITTLDWISDCMQHKKVLDTRKYIPSCLYNNDMEQKAKCEHHTDLDTQFIIKQIEDKLLIISDCNWKASLNVICFDMDGTLITTQSGNRFPKTWKDFRLLYDYTQVMEKKMMQYYSDGYCFVVFSNQKISHLKHKKPARFDEKIADLKLKIPSILKQLTVPFVYIAALKDDIYRKPHRGMFEYFNKNINLSRLGELKDILYIGDAAGREKGWKNGRSGNADFAGSDRSFAANCNMTFYTPEEFWLNSTKCLKFRWMDLQSILESAKSNKYPDELMNINNNEQEMIIMIGFPGSGKTTLYKRFFYDHNYKHINRDTTGSMEKCVIQCRMFVDQKYSVVIDNTNPSKKARKRFTVIANEYNIKIRCVWIQIDRSLSHHLNVMRWRLNESNLKIPVQAYKKFDKEFRPPQQIEGFSSIIKVPFVFDEALNDEEEFLLQT